MGSSGGEQVRVVEDLTAASSASGDIKNSRKIIRVHNLGSNFTISQLNGSIRKCYYSVIIKCRHCRAVCSIVSWQENC